MAHAPTLPKTAPSGRRVAATSLSRRRARTWFLFLLPALLVYGAFMAFPLLNSLRLSFYTGRGFRPEEFVGFDNYVRLFTDPFWRERFFNAVGNTFIFFFIHMLVQNTLGLLFATLLASGIRGHNLYRTIIFIPATLAVLVTGFLWRLILNPQWGAVNHFLRAVGLNEWARPWLGDEQTVLIVISLVSSWQWVGLPTMMFLAGLLTIPDELLEAARMDGASAWKVFTSIKLPLLAPVIGIVSVLTFVGNFNAFDVVFAMTGPKGDPGYAADLLASFFYRTGIAGEHPVARPDMGMGAAVAACTFVILLSGVGLWLLISRRRSVEM
jgi:raffinose/stachyose/melibiose transport system permease protein